MRSTSTVAIVTLKATDILFGRGSSISSRPGNCAFRRFVDYHRDDYVNGNRAEKKEIAGRVIRDVELQDPPGRFVESCGDGTFKLVARERAFEKSAQALREKYVKNDRLRHHRLKHRQPVTNESVTSAPRRPRISRKKKPVAKKSQNRAPGKPDKIVSANGGVTGPGFGSAKPRFTVEVASQVNHDSKEDIAKSKPKTISSVWGYESPKHCRRATCVSYVSDASRNEEKLAFASSKDHGGGADAYSNSLLHEALTQPLPFFDQIDQEFQTMRDTEMFAPKKPPNPTLHKLATTVKDLEPLEPLEPLFGFGVFSDTGSLVFETMGDYSIENDDECVSDSFRDFGQCGDI